MMRVKFRIAIAALGLLSLINTQAEPAGEVPVATDLRADACTARNQVVPILLEFAAPDCPYCEQLEAQILRPMLISGDYTGKVIIRKIMLDDGQMVRNFDGKPVRTDDLKYRYDVFVTPTMVLVNGDGDELTERIIGVHTIDFFGGEVDAAIDTARSKLASQDPPKCARTTTAPASS